MGFDLSSAMNMAKHWAQTRKPRALLLPHDNPDPDSLAAAAGLSLLLAGHGFECTIGMAGIIGRAENRAMVRVLSFDLKPIENLDLDSFGIVALLDTQPGTGNNSLPVSRLPDIVIDHHPPRALSQNVPWCDIRPEYGASCTVVWRYLKEANLGLSADLATAFLYGVKTETRDLGRECGPHEREAYLELSAQADHTKLYAITNPKLSREHFVAMDRACRRAICWGELLAVNLGGVQYPDLVAEVAELMLAYEKARYCLCLGEYEGQVFLSIRSEDEDSHAGELIRRVVGSKGAAGGHGMSAGGRLHQTVRNETELKVLYDELVAKMVAELGIAKPPAPLL